MSFLDNFFNLIRFYGDELMVIFIYLGWNIHIQYNCYMNLGHFVFNIFTTGEPLLITLIFYGSKLMVSWYRSMREIEKLNEGETG